MSSLLWRAVCIVVLVVSIGEGRVRAQMLGDDAACLRGLKASVKNGRGQMGSWTSSLLSNPCNSSSLQGIVCNNQRVFSITLKATDLSGFIPPSLGNCTYLQALDLSSNQLSGTIPSNIGNLSYLTSLNFSNNQLTGAIPVELSACIYLNIIDLRQNELTGQIPGQLGLLTRLRFFNVTNNQLSGPIPSTLSNSTSSGAPRFNASSFVGNKGLYGYPLPPEDTHSLRVAEIVGIGLGSGILSLIVSFAAVCIWLRITEQGYAAQEGKISQLSSSEY